MDINRGLYPAPNGGFQSANAALGIANGSEVTSDFIDDVYFELINILSAAGIEPATATPTQVLQSLRRIFGGNATVVVPGSTVTEDQLGFIELLGSAVATTALPSPQIGVQPLIMIFNATAEAQEISTPVGAFEGPGGSNANVITVAPGSLTFLRSDTSSYIVQQQYAGLNGSAAQGFAVAPATTAAQASQYQQVPGGYGVTFNNVTTSRALNIVYTNSTPRGIFVSVIGQSAGASENLAIYVNGFNLMGVGQTSTGSAMSVTAFVPPGSTYEVTGPNFTNWTEVV